MEDSKRGMRGVYQGVSLLKWSVRVVLRDSDRVPWMRLGSIRDGFIVLVEVREIRIVWDLFL